MRSLRLPPAPLIRSLSATLVAVFLLAAFVVAVVSAGVTTVDPVASFLWRFGFCAALMAVEFRRRRIRPFLAALGISRRGFSAALLVPYAVLELLYRLVGGP